jgi:molecular chaperone HscB
MASYLPRSQTKNFTPVPQVILGTMGRKLATRTVVSMTRLVLLRSGLGSATGAADCLVRQTPHQGGAFSDERTLSNTTASGRSVSPASCWKCGGGLGHSHGLFCEGCGTVQPPSASPANAYAMLVGTGESGALKFDIDLRELEQRYKTLQKVLHPDKYSSASSVEREYSAEQAIRVNMAYAALKDPISRADCLLQLAGVEEEEGRTIGTLPHHSEMLMTFMEWREEIEEASDEETLVGLRDRIQEKMEECMVKLKGSLNGARDIQQAKESVQVLRYLVRMRDAILDKM